ncbi:MAG TPA: methyltransferase domain-containing protein [Methylomirabilota bacterium]|nr:methyltransferase domain-containing protein [Methylomirabilota bacterium]
MEGVRVYCSEVLEHLVDPAAVAEIRRVLAPGGVAVLSVPDEGSSAAPPVGRTEPDAPRVR